MEWLKHNYGVIHCFSTARDNVQEHVDPARNTSSQSGERLFSPRRWSRVWSNVLPPVDGVRHKKTWIKYIEANDVQTHVMRRLVASD
jgi:hypothetical protein